MNLVETMENLDAMLAKENTNGANGANDANGAGAELFEALLQTYLHEPPRRGQVLEGQVIWLDDKALYLDVGAKRDAIVPYAELNKLGEDLVAEITAGDLFPVYVMRTPVGNEELLVSLEKGLMEQDWERAEACLAQDETLELEVVGHNKGGVMVQFERLQGFVPNSRVPQLRRVFARDEQQTLKSRLLGTTLLLKVLEVDRERRRLVLSATDAQREQQRAQLEALQPGQVMTGRVVNIVQYGAFIDLGAVQGLLHISKLAWERVNHPSDVLEVGDEIDVLVEKVNLEKKRVSLNRRELLPDPWEILMEKRKVGDLLEGEVTAVTDFGAFVRVPSGVEGLIHAGEMYMAGDGKPEDVLQPGEVVLVRIINMEPDRKRLGLSMRRVTAQESADWLLRRQAQAAQAA
jgi:small subunit ribosomal protein S1